MEFFQSFWQDIVKDFTWRWTFFTKYWYIWVGVFVISMIFYIINRNK